MQDKNILVTYFDGDNYSFAWLEDDEDVENWLDENKDDYTQIEIIRISGVEEIYKSE